MNHADAHIPPLKLKILTRFYDPLLATLFPENKFKLALIAQANIQDLHRVLDVGCGTGTLTVKLKERHPSAEIIGIDPDEDALKIALGKINKAGLSVKLQKGSACNLPFESGSFDRAVSCLVFHHLRKEEKLTALREILRVLKPEGTLHIADWGKPKSFASRIAYLTIQLTDGFETTRDNARGLIPEMMKDVGFRDVSKVIDHATPFGTFAFYRGFA